MDTPPLYRPTMYDAVYGLLPFRWWETVGASDSASQLISDSFQAVDRQYVLLIRGISIEFTGTSGQVPLSWALELPTAPRTTICGQTFPVSLTGANWRDFAKVDFVALEGEQLRVRSFWDAGVTNNTISCSLYGYRIPRANVQGNRFAT